MALILRNRNLVGLVLRPPDRHLVPLHHQDTRDGSLELVALSHRLRPGLLLDHGQRILCQTQRRRSETNDGLM